MPISTELNILYVQLITLHFSICVVYYLCVLLYINGRLHMRLIEVDSSTLTSI